jgi:phospholipase/carboxylesterase
MKKILLIFLHGYGANGADLQSLGPFFNDTAEEVVIESPNAIEPIPDYPGGFQWFPIGDMSEKHLQESCHSVYRKVIKMIQDFQIKHKVGYKETFLIGFSQGTMMALYSALAEKNLCNGVIGFSGGVFIDPIHIKADKSLKITLIHGEDDDVVPASGSIKSYEFLKKKGFNPHLNLLDNLPHSIDMRGIEIARVFIKG